MDLKNMGVGFAWGVVFSALDGLVAALVQRRGIAVPYQYKKADYLSLKLGFLTGILVGVLAALIEHYRQLDDGNASLTNSPARE